MNDYTTIGLFDNSFDPELAIIKGMLEEAEIKFYIKNKINRSMSPLTNKIDFACAMELCVETNRLKEAKEIYQNIKKNEEKKRPSFQDLSHKTDKVMIIVTILLVLVIVLMLKFK